MKTTMSQVLLLGQGKLRISKLILNKIVHTLKLPQTFSEKIETTKENLLKNCKISFR